MKKTLLIGLALGLVSLAATSASALDRRPAETRNGDLPLQGCLQTTTWTDCTAQKNIGGSGILGSSHDMTNVASRTQGVTFGQTRGADVSHTNTGGDGQFMDQQGRICVYCHHPHNAVSAGTVDNDTATPAGPSYSPLWNRRATAVRTYTGYNNGSMMGDSAALSTTDKRHALNAAAAGNQVAIAGVSLLCMSCHDGVTAMSAYSQGNDSGATGSSDNSGVATAADGSGNHILTSATSSFEGNMNNHHPMGFKYYAVQQADQEIASRDTQMVPLTGVSIKGLLYGAGDDATMECVTCHDVHNTANQTGAERFLWRSDNNSNFCLTCHLK